MLQNSITSVHSVVKSSTFNHILFALMVSQERVRSYMKYWLFDRYLLQTVLQDARSDANFQAALNACGRGASACNFCVWICRNDCKATLLTSAFWCLQIFLHHTCRSERGVRQPTGCTTRTRCKMWSELWAAFVRRTSACTCCTFAVININGS